MLPQLPAASSAANQQVTPNNCQAKPPNLFLNSPQVQPQMGMLNPQASVPFNSSNTLMPQSNGATATQPVTPNNCQGKPSNLFSNSPQVQPQMGMTNPHASVPFNNPSTHMPQPNGAPASQQVTPNNCQGKPPNLFQNSPQIQPQMRMLNPQASVPLNNPNTHMPQTNGAPAIQQVLPNCHGNPPNLFPNFQIQPQMGMLNPQMQMLFNTSNTPMINTYGVPMLGNFQNGFMTQMNTNQPFNQLFVPNCMNFPMYQNAGFPMQNMNQFIHQPMPNYNQAGPCNVPVYPNQVPRVLGPQNPNFIPNVQFCMVPTNVVMQPNNQNQPNLVNNAAQLAQVNTTRPNFELAPPQQAQNGFHPPVSSTSQGNCGNDNGINSPQAKWKNHQNRNFTNNPKRDGLQKRFQKNNNMQNGKGALRSHNKLGVKGYEGQAGKNPNFANSVNQTPIQPKKNLCLYYTEHEIQQWREERKKNYPSKANIEKKHEKNMKESEENDRTAKLRRQELKDILEKQAQLGCEVAEIPSHYLYDSEKKLNGKEENAKLSGKRAKFQNKKFNKRGNRPNDCFTKKQKFGENESHSIHNQNQQLPLNKREPTLLQKLLSADIRRDKTRLLQVFRFMVMNSFFKDWPQTPLSFPMVMAREAEAESEVVEQKPVLGVNVFEIKDTVILPESTCVNDDGGSDNDDDSDGDEDNCNDDENDSGYNKSSDIINGKAAYLGSLAENEGEEEEGEIVD